MLPHGAPREPDSLSGVRRRVHQPESTRTGLSRDALFFHVHVAEEMHEFATSPPPPPLAPGAGAHARVQGVQGREGLTRSRRGGTESVSHPCRARGTPVLAAVVSSATGRPPSPCRRGCLRQASVRIPAWLMSGAFSTAGVCASAASGGRPPPCSPFAAVAVARCGGLPPDDGPL